MIQRLGAGWSVAGGTRANDPRREPLRLLAVSSRAATICRQRRRAPSVPT
ncbi:MAG TPA: hypothetical protein VN193_06870 [Candidatus Angelobacter sp.]|nr:hypothetical protein [Candidatus Angelobacter sp.]